MATFIHDPIASPDLKPEHSQRLELGGRGESELLAHMNQPGTTTVYIRLNKPTTLDLAVPSLLTANTATGRG